MKKYYTVITAENGQDWAPQYGSYDRQEAEDERQALRVPGVSTAVIVTSDDQADIDAEIFRINGYERPHGVSRHA